MDSFFIPGGRTCTNVRPFFDRLGHFILDIPTTARQDSLMISHLSFETEGAVYGRLELVEKSREEKKMSFPDYSDSKKIVVHLPTGAALEYPVGIGFRLRGSLLKK